jgi:hypothetical protein
MRFLPAFWYAARTMPWRMLIAACASGLAISLVAHQFASQDRSALGVTLALRIALIPAAAAAAFLAADPQRDLSAALPAPAWLGAAMHTALALPVIGLTAYLQLELAATEIVGSRAAGTAGLPRSVLVAEFAAWSATGLAAAAAVDRTRWHDLGGGIAAPVTVMLIALFALLPIGSAWTWWAVAFAAALVAITASRDPWLRLRPVRSAPLRVPVRRAYRRSGKLAYL